MKTWTKYLILGAALAVLGVFIARSTSHSAGAQELPPPAKMVLLDAALTHAALLELGPVEKRRAELLKVIGENIERYRLDMNQQGEVVDKIDWDTGEIHRPQRQVAHAALPTTTDPLPPKK